MTTFSFLPSITSAVQDRFTEARSILSFGEYTDALQEHAPSFCRNSTQYLLDAILFFGARTLEKPYGSQQRYRIFDKDLPDLPHLPQKDAWVAGQEDAQSSIVRMLENFVREGRNTRLLLLHGPNGSGKSSILQALIQALERYSYTHQGALYRFNWIFPSERKVKKTGLGFTSNAKNKLDLGSYAHLEGDQIDARVLSDLKDHPLLLLPRPERHALFQRLKDDKSFSSEFKLSDYLLEGDLSSRNRLIFDALLAHYGGDYAEVLRHVQVERYYISQRYRRGIVTIEPQMHVDAVVRQITADHSFANLPKPLVNLNLFEPMGALVDANRGLLEFSDLLKRPLEAFKYLLGTCETGRVTVDPIILFLDMVMLGSANDQNLDRFKEISEFSSFKSRIELIRVPYLLRFSVEEEIYEQQIKQSNLPKFLTPHTIRLAAMWAVLTRLKRPNPKRLPKEIASLAETLSPIEKLFLYNTGQIPTRFHSEQAKLLRQHITALYEESQNDVHYEGRIGASAREIRIALLNAAQNEKYPSLSPLALFEEFERLVQDRSLYEFLQIEAQEGYYDPLAFVQELRKIHLDLIDREFRAATGIIAPDQFSQQIKRYIQNVKAHLQKEKVLNPVTRSLESPDQSFLTSVENVLLKPGEDREKFRHSIIGRIAAWSIEHPSQEIDLPSLFPEALAALEKDAFAQQRKRLERLAKHCLVQIVDKRPHLSDSESKEAKETIQALIQTYSYSEPCVRELLPLLLRFRYADAPPPLNLPPKPEK